MRIFPTLLIVFAVLIAACDSTDRSSSAGTTQTDSRALVVVSNYPLYFFAARIVEGVDSAPDIEFPDVDGDPAFWTPNADQIQLLQSANAVILNGAGAEPWLNLISIDKSRVTDTTASIRNELIPLEGSVLHQHGPGGEHSHEGMAFTTWLDPQLAIQQAQAVMGALIQLAPVAEAEFRDNMSTLEQELTQLDSELADVFARLDGRPVLFSHPVYQYLQRRYEINGQSVHWEPGEEPTTSAWIDLQQIVAVHPATTMIWEDDPLPSTAQRLAEAGISSVYFQTAANRPDQGDYLDAMRANASRFAAYLGE